jgi:uncharacterized protein YegJ (DUF2314 family)
MRRCSSIVIFGLGVLASLAAEGSAQSLLDKAKRDETVRLELDDPAMEAAKQKGKATLAEFLALARAPKATMSNFTIKVGIPAAHGAEYVWVRPFEKRARRYVGQLRSTPLSNQRLKYGDTISFGEKDIVDWYYLDEGKMKGNFTACALLAKEPKENAEAFKKEYGLECAP